MESILTIFAVPIAAAVITFWIMVFSNYLGL